MKDDHAHEITHLKNDSEKATLTLEKESSTAKLAYEKQISDLKAQCADDHAVAQLKKDEHQTDERLKSEEESTATGVLRLKVQALEQELQMAKDATAEKETKVVLLQKA